MRGAVSTVFRDFTLLMVLGFVAMVIWLLPHINPPGEGKEGADPPGNVIVAIHWPEGDTDIDIWLTGPGEINPVGYSNKSGTLFNLLRDDLGAPDTKRNYENAYSRGKPAGEYIINVHCYRCATFPQPVHVEVSLSGDAAGKTPIKQLVETTVNLTKNGQELTALRFRLTEGEQIEANSLNSVFRPLRNN